MRIFFWACCFICSLFAEQAYGNDREEILQIENYLNSLKHIAAKFVQVDSNKNVQRGNFFLSRPGKLKWEYLDPKRITIVFNEDKIFYHDKDLDQRSEYKTKDSLIYFLISPNINFSEPDSEYYLESFGKTEKWIELEVKKKADSKDQALVLRFTSAPLKLISVELKDSLQIFIDSVIEYKALDKNLFNM
jgi:outer membrane lipoprotein-sorting protein